MLCVDTETTAVTTPMVAKFGKPKKKGKLTCTHV